MTEHSRSVAAPAVVARAFTNILTEDLAATREMSEEFAATLVQDGNTIRQQRY